MGGGGGGLRPVRRKLIRRGKKRISKEGRGNYRNAQYIFLMYSTFVHERISRETASGGGGMSRSSSNYSNMQAPDMDDVKESVKQVSWMFNKGDGFVSAFFRGGSGFASLIFSHWP